MNEIVMGSKLVIEDDGNGRKVYFCRTTTGKQFWSNEPLNAGTLVHLTEKKAGEKYADKDGVEQTVKKDGYNLDIITAKTAETESMEQLLANFRAAKEMRTEMEAI